MYNIPINNFYFIGDIMILGLASYEFINNNIDYNINQIEKALKSSIGIDLLCFGEAFLQGFDAFNWDYMNDKKIAISKDSSVMKKLETMSNDYNVDLGFGYLEIENDNLYSSYAIIVNGKLKYNYRRISIGWKEYTKTNEHYKEGNEVLNLNYKGKDLTVALCGDLWEYPERFKSHELLLWPVYVNFTIEEWQSEENEYAEQALITCENTMMINSISKNPNCFGGCFYFKNGKIEQKLNYNTEGVLIIEI